MFSTKFKKYGNKEKIKKLINLGLFDKHIDELSKALYTKRAFTKDIKCFLNNLNNNKIDNTLTPKNKKVTFEQIDKTRSKSKELCNNSNSNIKIKKTHNAIFDENKFREDKFNEEMQKLLISLNNSQNETNKRFKELSEENNLMNSLYKLYIKVINSKNKNSNDNNKIFFYLYELLLKYKSSKNLSFEINSLYSDVLKDNALATNDLEKLKFFYIINGEKYDNNYKSKDKIINKNEIQINPLLNMQNYNSSDNSSNKIETPKEPRIFDISQIKNLKEMKYLNKINKLARDKIIIDGKIIGKKKNHSMEKIDFSIFDNKSKLMKKNENYEEKEDDNYEINSYENNIEGKVDNKSNIKIKGKKLRFDIIKDIEDINTIKRTIKDSFSPRKEKKINIQLKTTISNFESVKNKSKFNEKNRNNLNLNLNNNIKKKQEFFSIDIENNNKNINKRFNFLKPLINRSSLKKNTSYDKFSMIKDKGMKDIFHRLNNININNNSFLSNKNLYQHSTFYSNKSLLNFNNHLNTSKLSLNNSINMSNKFNNSSTKKVTIIEDNFLSSNLNENNESKFEKKKNKSLKKSKTLFRDDVKSELVENILNNRTEKVYHIAQNINTKNKNETINKINDYLKFKNSKLPSLYLGEKLKDTFSFLHKIKREVKNNDIKLKYKNIRKMLNEKDRKRLKDIDLIESNIFNKDKELLYKTLKNKY